MQTADYSFIKKCIDGNLRFAAFCQPGKKDFTIVLQKDSKLNEVRSVKNLHAEKGFIFIPFDQSSKHKSIIIQDDIVLKEGDAVPNDDWVFTNANDKAGKNGHDVIFSSKTEYTNQFNSFFDLLTNKSLQKIILSRIIRYDTNAAFDISSLFRKLNQSYTDAFTYILNTPESGCWLGASPEQLLKVEKEHAFTVSLAGTQKCNGDDKEKISWHDKDVVEQQFVSDYIDSLLKKYVPENNLLKEKKTVQAGNVLHLKTLFTFPSSSIREHLGQFISELHPTPAVCGLPKHDAFNAIINTESHDREYYSGFMGLLNVDETTDLYVNLRCLKVQDNNVCIYAGGGLTINSEPDKEWEETNLKAHTLISVLDKLTQN